MNQITNFGAAILKSGKKILVMPNCVGTNSLLVDKSLERFNMSDLREVIRVRKNAQHSSIDTGIR